MKLTSGQGALNRLQSNCHFTARRFERRRRSLLVQPCLGSDDSHCPLMQLDVPLIQATVLIAAVTPELRRYK